MPLRPTELTLLLNGLEDRAIYTRLGQEGLLSSEGKDATDEVLAVMARARRASEDTERGSTPTDVIVRVLRVSPYLTSFGRDLSRADPRFPTKQSDLVKRWKAQKRGVHHSPGTTRNLAPPSAKLPEVSKPPIIEPKSARAPARPRLSGWLSGMEGDTTGESYPLHEGYNNVGKGDDQDIVLRHDAHVDDAHVRIRIEKNRVWVYDLNSTSGTILDGAPLRPGIRTAVRSGAKLEIGSTTLVLTIL